MFKKIQNIHFIGIGGSGMSGIAEVLLTLGYKVSGSDLKSGDVTDRLAKLGAKIYIGHKAEQVQQAHVVVTSTAIKDTNPEAGEALRLKIPVIPRIEMLAELARLKYTIAVAGTHGKTTTTSLISMVLQSGNLDPTVIVGGRMHNIGTGARVGRGDYIVAEADESDGSFLKLAPTLAIVTNIDNDHLDYWGNMEVLRAAFQEFTNKIPFYGMVFVGIDSPESQKVLGQIRRPCVTYGLTKEADVNAQNIQITDDKTIFDVYRFKKKCGTIHWSIPGRHNIANSLAAVSVGLELGISFETIAQALDSYSGVGRRLEMKGEADGILVIDDYGHHPTEIKATLQALNERYSNRRLVVLFQPHRYSRTELLVNEFKECFNKETNLFLTDIYPAGEKPIPGIDSQWLLKKFGHDVPAAQYFSSNEGVSSLLSFLKPGDVVLTLGAGDVWKWGEILLKELKTRSLESSSSK